MQSSSSTAAPDTATARSARQTKVYFHTLWDGDVQFGEVIAVVGNHESLGKWNPEHGLRLSTKDSIWPCWVSEQPLSLDVRTQVEYKYVLLDTQGQGKAWEETEDGKNRSFVASGVEMTIEDDNGLYRDLQGVNTDDEGESALRVKSKCVSAMDEGERVGFVKELEGRVDIDSRTTIFMVSLRLPCTVVRNDKGEYALSDQARLDGRNFAFQPLLKELRNKNEGKAWRIVNVGWPGVFPETSREKMQLEKELSNKNMIGVYPPRQDFQAFQNFCTSFLFPVFHDSLMVFQAANPQPFDEKGWAAYQYMNNIYASYLVAHINTADLIWIHDYHLMMTPTFISRKVHMANIGLFFHAPFPSPDSFKCLPMREELLSGILSADLIGFQFFPDARNFFSSVKRMHGFDPTFKAGGFMGVDYNGRHVMVKVGHFVYPYSDAEKLVRLQFVEDNDESRVAQAGQLSQIKKLFEGSIVFAGMDKCDGLSGLLAKFRAFRRFVDLNAKKSNGERAVLVQYVFDSMNTFTGVASLRDALLAASDAFIEKQEDGTLTIKLAEGVDQADAVIYLRLDWGEGIDRIERLGLFRTADILLDSAVKAGLNLMPFEFIAAHFDDEETSRTSVAIVSEFSGCSKVLNGALKSNPWNASELAMTCEKALSMTKDEKRIRQRYNLQYCRNASAMEWFEDFMADLRRARKKEGIRIQSIGFGAKIRQVCVGPDFQKLNTEQVVKAYRNSKNRVFFLDNEGTLAADTRNMQRQYGAHTQDITELQSHGTAPDDVVMKCLQVLSDDTNNTIFILTGRDKEMMQNWFGSLPKLGLAAERGFYYKMPLAGSKWSCAMPNPDSTWRSYAFEIMNQFVRRTQGSYVENKGSALVWQYRDADIQFGSLQAKELSSHLKELLFGFDVEVINGKGYVEVKLRGISKGTTVETILKNLRESNAEVDFVLCLGDDRSDESMFEALAAQAKPKPTVDDETVSTTDGDESQTPPKSNTPQTSPQIKALKFAGSFDKEKKGSFDYTRRPSYCATSTRDLAAMGSGNLYRPASSELDAGQKRKDPKFFTCTVGRKPSAAAFFLDDTEEVSDLLMALRQETERRRKAASGGMNTWSGANPFQYGNGHSSKDGRPMASSLFFGGSQSTPSSPAGDVLQRLASR